MLLFKKPLLLISLTASVITGWSQRVYTPASVLASGTFYKIAVPAAGIYRIDLPFLASLGVNTTNLSSSSIRLFGNGGGMLAESNNAFRIDDLRENAIQVVDGNDGVLNGSDYLVFFAEGPDKWIKDSANQRFSHQKNLYAGYSYYFITIGGSGKRIAEAPQPSNPSLTVSSFSGRFFHELDTVNFLSSGREWYGEEFSQLPGRSLTRNFPFSMPNLVASSPVQIRSHCIGRSAGIGSSFSVSLNGTTAGQINIPPIGNGQYEPFARESVSVNSSAAGSTSNSVAYTFTPGSVNAQGWLNFFEVFGRQQLTMNGLNQLLFRDWLSVGNQNAEFVLGAAAPTTQIWEVTDPLTPRFLSGHHDGSALRFINDCSRLREYVAFNPQGLMTPLAIGRISTQNLHATSPTDYIIITHANFLAQAQRLAQFHRQRNSLRVVVATTEQVFNEFGSGSPDPAALRDFVKMYFDKYGNDPANRLRYLLLFGDASFDYRDRLTGNTNFVPAYENPISLDVLNTYTSDDFFGFLEDSEDINSGLVINTLDIGIGRVPAKNQTEAKNFVDKVEAYTSVQSFGPWRNNLLFIADDEDQNLHLQDAETVTATAGSVAPVFDLQKVYLDAFRQESGSGGSRYPQVNQTISNQVYNGVLIWNFNGHGGATRLTDETILDQEMVNTWNNANRLPLFITATCDFAPYDNPYINSLGENILLRQNTGAIALMTTTRIVFAYSNRIMNDNYLRFALQPDANGRYRSLGDAVRDAKNFTYQSSADITNNRKFALLGDPALTLAFPVIQAKPVRINGIPVAQTDTLQATEKVTIEGEITDLQGNFLPAFNGTVYPTVFDKPKQVTTLGNDPASPPVSFSTQTNQLFRGKATVVNGRFSFSFTVPKDINYQYGNGKISLYAENGSRDGTGFFTGFLVGGSANTVNDDKDGPGIKAYLNDERFVNGGITNENPVLLLKLADSSGINTAGTGIGHDIVATLDGDNSRYFVLNDFYQSGQDSYQKGTVRFQMTGLEPGHHTLKIKAWDVLNNSNEVSLDFVVAKDEELEISHVLNYPNPFTTNTQFWFEHNKPGQDLVVKVQIFTVSGRIIKMLERTINTPGNRSIELTWDGLDEYGQKIGRGVYLYKLSVTVPGKTRKEKIGKLVIF
ncbi:MAG: type IX secretion system sortase PorU [Chitinophagaceae bacterium]|nr:type IX secretion system sortase PorU [Chitinophagaceae bacterium]